MFVISLILQPFLVLVPPLFPFDVVIEGEVTEVTEILVVLVPDSHIIPGGQARGAR